MGQTEGPYAPTPALRMAVYTLRPLSGCNIFPSALGLCERASVQVSISRALL